MDLVNALDFGEAPKNLGNRLMGNIRTTPEPTLGIRQSFMDMMDALQAPAPLVWDAELGDLSNASDFAAAMVEGDGGMGALNRGGVGDAQDDGNRGQVQPQSLAGRIAVPERRERRG